VLVYPGICRSCGSKRTGATGISLVTAVPANASDPLCTRWTKRGVIVNNTRRDPSSAWRLHNGDWRLTTYTGKVLRGTPDFTRWRYEMAAEAGGGGDDAFVFPSGECPSMFPLPRLATGPHIAPALTMNRSGPGVSPLAAPASPYPQTSPLPTHVHKCSHGGKDWVQVGTCVPAPGIRAIHCVFKIFGFVIRILQFFAPRSFERSSRGAKLLDLDLITTCLLFGAGISRIHRHGRQHQGRRSFRSGWTKASTTRLRTSRMERVCPLRAQHNHHALGIKMCY